MCKQLQASNVQQWLINSPQILLGLTLLALGLKQMSEEVGQVLQCSLVAIKILKKLDKYDEIQTKFANKKFQSNVFCIVKTIMLGIKLILLTEL